MRWLCVLALWCFFVSSLSPEDSEPPSASLPSLAASSASWDELDSLLDSLSSEAEGLSLDYERLKTWLTEARSQLEALSSQLRESQTVVSALSSSLNSSVASLKTCEESLLSSLRSRSLELWIWRGAAAGALVVALAALVR